MKPKTGPGLPASLPHIIGKIPAVSSLTATFGVIAGGVPVSLWQTRGQPAAAEST
jgi:tellurite resistance protein TerC